MAKFRLQRFERKIGNPSFLHVREDSVDRFLSCCHRKKYPNKTTIIRPGDLANTLYYIVDGSVTVSTEDDEGHELILAYLNKGDFIGEMGLFVETERRDVLVRTKTPCEMAEIGYEHLSGLLQTTLKEEATALMYAIGAQLTKRLLATSRKVSRLAFMDVTSRVAKTLLDLCEEPDAMSHPDGMQIRISRQEISRIVGCSREMVGRVLKNLEEEGSVSVSGKTIVVLGTR